MCVALPGVVKEIKEDGAVVDFSGNEVFAMTGIVPVKVGDRVLVHAGCVIQIMSEAEAKELEDIFAEVGAVGNAV